MKKYKVKLSNFNLQNYFCFPYFFKFHFSSLFLHIEYFQICIYYRLFLRFINDALEHSISSLFSSHVGLIVSSVTSNYHLPEGIERQMKFDVRLYTIPSSYASKIPLIAPWSAKNNPIIGDHESPADSGRKSNPFLDLRLI